MKKFLWAAVWVASLGIVSNFLAPFLPRSFRMDRFPFRLYSFERGGRLYDRIAIRRWKKLVPDMSQHMSSEEYDALVRDDASAVVFEGDRPAVGEKLMLFLQDRRDIDFTYRVLHKTRGFVWVHG